MFKLYPYKVGSASVRKLKEALSALIIKTEGSRYRYKDTDIVINWGNSHRSDVMESVPMLNAPEAVALATNKLRTFVVLEEAGVPHVPFTTDASVAHDWLSDNSKVFVRDTLTGHSGEGISVVQWGEANREQLTAIAQAQMLLDAAGLESASDALDDEYQLLAAEIDMPDAPLYTRGVTNAGEYRVHVFDGEVILYQKKSRRVDEDGNVVTADGADADIRNLASNWIYRTGNLRRLERVEELARNAVNALGLDFGAVDIIMDTDGTAYVLEVNSAPGLGNTETMEAYVNAFNSLTE